MRLKLISCEVFQREIQAAVAASPNEVEVEFLSMGLHEIGCALMRQHLQEAIDRVPRDGFEAVLMGYGLCSNGLVGLQARSLPLVVPRAHDCITLLMGSKERYLQYFNDHPGVYFKSSGWIEHSTSDTEMKQFSIAEQHGMYADYNQLVEKYGEDNAKYLFEELCQHARNYRQFTFIEMGVEPDDRFEKHSRDEAAQRGWNYEKIAGDLGLIQRLVDGDWRENEFLVVNPGWQVAARYDENIITAEEINS